MAVAALMEVAALENGDQVKAGRLSNLLQLVERAVGMVQGEGDEGNK